MKPLLLWIALGLAPILAKSQTPSGPQTVFQEDFETPGVLQAWSGRATLGPGCTNGHSAAVESQAGAAGATISRAVPLELLRGASLRASIMVKADSVSPKPNPWNGVKFMLVCQTPTGTTWPQAALETGSFGWRRAGFFTRVPAETTNVTLVLGLEQVTGKAWFDDLRLTVVHHPSPPSAKLAAGAAFKGHDLPRLRGTMISPGINAESLRVLGQDWHANLIRWQLIRTGPLGSDQDYDFWLEGELKRLEHALPLCDKYGLRVALDLHSPPGGKPTGGGYAGSDDRFFTDPRCQAKFVQIWRSLAVRFKSSPAIWGYDLANEPVEDDLAEGCEDWQGLAERAARAIREIDPQRAIIVEPANWGGPDGFRDLVPLSVSNVVYSVHMYLPTAFTHQGVFASGPPVSYPGEIQGVRWDKARLEQALLPVIEFQQRYGVHIYAGEFSAIRWAPGDSARRYLADLIDLFETHGWDWTYHAFREWDGWSVEHGPDRQDPRPAPAPTDRQQLLTHWFAENRKPGDDLRQKP